MSGKTQNQLCPKINFDKSSFFESNFKFGAKRVIRIISRFGQRFLTLDKISNRVNFKSLCHYIEVGYS